MTCLFYHGHRTKARDASGQLVLRCDDCGHEAPILQAEMKTDGPRHQPQPVPGQPTGKVRRHATRTKVSPFRQER